MIMVMNLCGLSTEKMSTDQELTLNKDEKAITIYIYNRIILKYTLNGSISYLLLSFFGALHYVGHRAVFVFIMGKQ